MYHHLLSLLLCIECGLYAADSRLLKSQEPRRQMHHQTCCQLARKLTTCHASEGQSKVHLLPSPRLPRLWSTYMGTTVSPSVTVPESGCSWPISILKRVDLPAPLLPVMPASREAQDGQAVCRV